MDERKMTIAVSPSEPLPPGRAEPWAAAGPTTGKTDCYRLTAWRTQLHRATRWLPPAWREAFAERWLRRSGAPGPAAEHAMQYLLSAARRERNGRERCEATMAKGADSFYAKQYRQTLNGTMGAFAMTAIQVLACAGGAMRGHGRNRCRRTYAALLEEQDGMIPILVLNDQAVAVAVSLPRLRRAGEAEAVRAWLKGGGAMPDAYRGWAAGETVRCHDRPVLARERGRDGSPLELLEAVLASRRLALLALHPHDPDAMGLHITLFDVAVLTLEQLERDHRISPAALAPYWRHARREDRLLLFCVGGTEEVFTQCSQNLFVKRPMAPHATGRESFYPPPEPWHAGLPLERLLASQFEAIQITVSSTGLPGASPRNGDLGHVAFVGRRRGRVFLLVPYYPGNLVHGHAAKMWSNPYGTLVISDDHASLRRVSLSGPARVAAHGEVRRRFPAIAEGVPQNHGAKSLPEYWFVQEVAQMVVQREHLAPHRLDPARPTCSISAGGHARHGKKPHYFAAEGLPRYDLKWQHRREAEGRPSDPDGTSYRNWSNNVQDALRQRRRHLDEMLGGILPPPEP